MAGAYCKFCGHRCFVYRVIPDGPSRGWSGHLATCQLGMMHDLMVTGHTHITAINPVTEPDAAAAIPAPVREGWAVTAYRWSGTDRKGVCPEWRDRSSRARDGHPSSNAGGAPTGARPLSAKGSRRNRQAAELREGDQSRPERGAK